MAGPSNLQAALALEIVTPPALAHFVAGTNRELLEQLLGAVASPSSFRALHLWGGGGVGKSFLCEATRREFVSSGTSAGLEVHDDIDRIPAEDQPSLLARFERLKEVDRGLWLSTSRAPPVQLTMLADLRSRLGWGLVFELKALRDEELQDALAQWAQRRALPLAPEVLPWLLRHSERSLPYLLRILLRLDRFGLERKRGLSLPLLKEMLQACP